MSCTFGACLPRTFLPSAAEDPAAHQPAPQQTGRDVTIQSHANNNLIYQPVFLFGCVLVLEALGGWLGHTCGSLAAAARH
jgi:hypothetical protein